VYIHLTDETTGDVEKLAGSAELKPRRAQSTIDDPDTAAFPSQWCLRGGGACVVSFGGQVHTLTFKGLSPTQLYLGNATPNELFTQAHSIRFSDRLRFTARLVHKTVRIVPAAARVATKFEVQIAAEYRVVSNRGWKVNKAPLEVGTRSAAHSKP
jgi:hypothetical protein